MNEPENVSCDWVQDRIEAAVDGELQGTVLQAFSRHVDKCPVCAGELALAQRIQTSLHRLPIPPVPPRVASVVFERIEAGRLSKRRKLARVGYPAVLAAAAVILALVGIRLWDKTERHPTVSVTPPASGINAEELKLAENQARLAFAYISGVSHQTGLTVRDDIIGKRVAGSVEKSLERAMSRDAQ